MPNDGRPDPAGAVDKAATLEAMRAARKAMVEIRTKYPINGPEYAAAGVAMVAVDIMAERLTGRRDWFWTRSH